MNRDKTFGFRAPSEWRSLLGASIFLIVFGIVMVSTDLLFLSVFAIIAAPCVAFVAGYLMRADETHKGRKPHLPFLYVEGDASGESMPDR